mgnify:CR=1 FL=1
MNIWVTDFLVTAFLAELASFTWAASKPENQNTKTSADVMILSMVIDIIVFTDISYNSVDRESMK